MKRQQFAGSFLLLEGDTDARFYRGLVEQNNCQIVNAQTKSNAIEAIQILEDDGFVGALAVVDADFMVVAGVLPQSSNIILTDGHDLEMMLVLSPALDKVLTEFGSEVKVQRFSEGTDVRSALMDLAMPVGFLRWLSERDGLSLRFEGLGFNQFLDRATLQMDMRRLIVAVKNHSQRHDLRDDDLLAGIEALARLSTNVAHVCCGHDVVEVLSIGLRRVLGTAGGTEVQAATVERALRLAYERAYFGTTPLHQRIRHWENRNPGFRVLPDEG